MLRKFVFLIMALALAALAHPVRAQQSTNYWLTEWTLNEGGDPVSGIVASSSWRIKLDAVGDAVIGTGLASASWHLDSGFVGVYRPAAEVLNLRWTGSTTLSWDAEISVGVYELYRDLISNLPGGFGNCFQSSITGESWTDASLPALGQGWFYLATARNRIGEEGTKGYQTGGGERSNPSPCP